MIDCRNEFFWYGFLQEFYELLQKYERIVVHSRRYGLLQEKLWFCAGIC